MKITYGHELIIDLQGCNTDKFDEENINKYIYQLCDLLEMKRYGEPLYWKDTTNTPHLKGVSVIQFISTSDIVIHTLDILESVLINIFSCRDFSKNDAYEFTKSYFGCKNSTCKIVKRMTKAYDNPKIYIESASENIVRAKEDVFKDEIIAVFDGKHYYVDDISLIPNNNPIYAREHVIKYDKDKYRDSRGLARYIGHSNNFNTQIKEKFVIFATKDIKQGEIITRDHKLNS